MAMIRIMTRVIDCDEVGEWKRKGGFKETYLKLDEARIKGDDEAFKQIYNGLTPSQKTAIRSESLHRYGESATEGPDPNSMEWYISGRIENLIEQVANDAEAKKTKCYSRKMPFIRGMDDDEINHAIEDERRRDRDIERERAGNSEIERERD
jgi:hypothetical protein